MWNKTAAAQFKMMYKYFPGWTE